MSKWYGFITFDKKMRNVVFWKYVKLNKINDYSVCQLIL